VIAAHAPFEGPIFHGVRRGAFPLGQLGGSGILPSQYRGRVVAEGVASPRRHPDGLRRGRVPMQEAPHVVRVPTDRPRDLYDANREHMPGLRGAPRERQAAHHRDRGTRTRASGHGVVEVSGSKDNIGPHARAYVPDGDAIQAHAA